MIGRAGGRGKRYIAIVRPPPAIRLLLAPPAAIYDICARVRNLLFDANIIKKHRLPVPVISVGNLTAGGTGKTPCTFQILDWARARNIKIAVLTRGYGGHGGANDEVMMLQSRFPGTAVGIGGDRAASAVKLLASGGVDAFLLDDGFQHRRVARDLNILLIDAMDPFGGGACLPAGMLREPAAGIRRADLIIITKTVEAGRARVDAAWNELIKLNYQGPRIEASHAPAALEPLDTRRANRPLEDLRGARVHLLSSIGRPESFEFTVRALGAEILEHRAFRDHYTYLPADLPDMRDVINGREFWIVTEKDAVKLRRLGVVDGYLLKVNFNIHAGGDALDEALARLLCGRRGNLV